MNKFDQLAGLKTEHEALDGFLSKMVGKVRKVTRKVRKATAKITPKPMRKLVAKVEAEGARADRNGITKKVAIIAAGVGLAFVGGPALMAGMKAAGGLAAKGAALAKTGIIAAAKSGVISTVVKKGLEAKSAKQGAQAAKTQADAELIASQNLAAAIGQMPEFKQIVDQLRSEGYSEQEILAHWVESKAYYQNAIAAASETIRPQIKQNLVANGVPEQYAEDESWVQAHKISTNSVEQVQQEITGKSGTNLLIPAALLLMSFLG